MRYWDTSAVAKLARQGVDSSLSLGQIGTMKKKADQIDPAVLAGYNQWLGEHYAELVKKYPTRYVAVHHGTLVAVGDSFKQVREAARAQGCAEPILTMQIPSEEELTGAVSVY